VVSSDTVVGIVGAVILTGAMIAVFYYENSNAGESGAADIGEGSNLYTYRFAQTNNTTETVDPMTTSGNGPGNFNFDLPAYVYSIHVIVEWQNDGGGLPQPLQSGRDTLRVLLINEAGTELENDQGNSGSIELTHAHQDDNTTPPEGGMRVAADSEADANQTLEQNLSSMHGAGRWTVRVEFVNGGTGATAGQDTTEQFTATVHYSYWKPELQR